MNAEQVLHTGTTTIGIIARDGIVFVADKRATAGNFIANKSVEKIQILNDRMAITTAGSVSDVQLLTKYIKAEIKLKEISTNREASVKEAANLLAGIVYNNVRQFSAIPGISHFLFAGVDGQGFHLYDLYADGSLTECDDFVSSGSGSVMAYGVLETLYKKEISIEAATELGLKALQAALNRDSASGNGADVVVITKKGVKKVATKQIDTNLK
ncbi:proteasome subunit beta [Candidatus Woesearchaeota archaeon]|nr:proteasome subunit beta [Candidatus Woesearchaeota archaeon]